MSGSGVYRQYLIYKNIVSSYDYDVVVIAPHLRDILINALEKRVSIDGYTGAKIAIFKPFFTWENEKLILHNVPVPKEREFYFVRTGSTWLFEPITKLKQLFNPYLPQNLKARLFRLKLLKKYYAYQSENNPQWLLMRRLLAEMIDLAGKKTVLLVPLPYYLSDMNPEYREPFIHLAEQYENVFFVDVIEKFKREEDCYKLSYKKDAHYSE